jgi:hypothetical protein
MSTVTVPELTGTYLNQTSALPNAHGHADEVVENEFV